MTVARRVGYLLVLVESVGPTTRAEGRVLGTATGARTVRNCIEPTACRETTYPSYAVTGERLDGSTWIVVGEAAHEAMTDQQGVDEHCEQLSERGAVLAVPIIRTTDAEPPPPGLRAAMKIGGRLAEPMACPSTLLA